MKNCWNKLLIFSFFLIAMSCNIKKELTINDFSKINVDDLITKVNSTTTEYKWINIRGKLKINNQDSGVPLGFSLKMAKDSLIWISITAPIIGEVNRVMISRDSIYSIDRTKSTWFIKNLIDFKDEYGLDLSLSTIERIITNSVLIPKQNYLSSQELNTVTLDSQNDSTTYVVNLNSYSIESFVRKFSASEKLTVNYFDTQMIDSVLYPKKLIISTTNKKLSFELILNKIKVLEKDKVSFKIPKKYNETK